MTPLRTSICRSLCFGLFALGACNMTPMMSGPAVMTARLSGTSEVPATTSDGTGMVEATLNRQTSELSWTVSYSGLSGPVTAAHFHGPAMPGQNAGVVMPLAGSMTSPIKGSAMLSAAQLADLTAGKWYVNLHTAANPNGEIRGQVTMR